MSAAQIFLVQFFEIGKTFNNCDSKKYLNCDKQVGLNLYMTLNFDCLHKKVLQLAEGITYKYSRGSHFWNYLFSIRNVQVVPKHMHIPKQKLA